MRRLFFIAVFISAIAFLIWDRFQPPAPLTLPSPPPITTADPAPVFSPEELARIRQSLNDGDPSVRWSAVQLLFNIRDPDISQIAERMLSSEPDEQVRAQLVTLFKGRDDLIRLGALVQGLRDTEKSVRIASLRTLGDIGDASVSAWVTAALRDSEPEVRVEALRTLGRFQEKRRQEFKVLAEKLRKDYEDAVERSRSWH